MYSEVVILTKTFGNIFKLVSELDKYGGEAAWSWDYIWKYNFQSDLPAPLRRWRVNEYVIRMIWLQVLRLMLLLCWWRWWSWRSLGYLQLLLRIKEWILGRIMRDKRWIISSYLGEIRSNISSLLWSSFVDTLRIFHPSARLPLRRSVTVHCHRVTVSNCQSTVVSQC